MPQNASAEQPSILFSADLLPLQNKKIIVKYPQVIMQSRIVAMPTINKVANQTKNNNQNNGNQTGNNNQATSDGNNNAEGEQHQDVTLKNGAYYYSQVPDGCHKLDNGFAFCTTNGKISAVQQPVYRHNSNGDAFFYEKDIRCQIAKFDIVNELFLKKAPLVFDEYQLLIYNPELVKLIVLHRNNDERMAFFLTEKNEVGCLPYGKIKVYDIAESQAYPLYLEKYTLVGPYNDQKDTKKELLMTVDGTRVVYYNSELVQQIKQR